MTCQEYKHQYGTKVFQHSQKTKNHISNVKINPRSKLQQIKKQKLQNYNEVSHLQPLQCKICGFTSQLSIITHITRKHKISMAEYREKWPNETVQRLSTTTRQKVSSSVKEWLSDPQNKSKVLEKRSFPSEIKHWINKGYDELTAQQKVKDFQSKLSKLGNNPRTRMLRSQKYSGEDNPSSLTSIAKRIGCSLDEARQYTPCWGRTKEKHPMWGKKHTQESLELIASAHHLRTPRYRSKGEEEVAQYCQQQFESVQLNTNVKRYNVDVLIDNKIIVEFFGDLWHMNPIKWKETDTNPVTKKNAKYIWSHDAKKLKMLTSLGYNVITIWEYDWKNSRQECEKRIIDAYNNKR
jgi:G:T-mismatch repair DNA endonuclease (very short patch repair protein)